MQYAANKVVEGAGYLYNKINENIKGTQNNNNNEKGQNEGNNDNFQLNDGTQKSNLVFEKAEGIEDENEIKIEEYPTFSSINREIEKNKNENSDEKK